MMFDPVSLIWVNAGNLKAIGVMSINRTPDWPKIPTAQEMGFDVNTRSWFGIFAPNGLSTSVVDPKASEIDKSFKADETCANFLKVNQFADFSGSATIADQVRRDSVSFKDLIKSANIRVD